MISLLIDLFAVMLYKKLLSQAALVYILEYGVFVLVFLLLVDRGENMLYGH